ncbi:MAG: alanine racemase [Candidatus Omnitrophica bacterium]|nr:alanine racemase [Candidatus Omnitrophota bacterium]
MRYPKKKIGFRPTWADVDLRALAYNFGKIRRRLDRGTRIMATIKADAYGHGLIPVARKLVACGVDWFGVASIDEGIKLRKHGIRLPVLVMGLILKEDIPPLFTWDLVPTVCTLDFARALDREARRRRRRIGVHIKVDTGMGRIGVEQDEARTLVGKIVRLARLKIEGLFTHFAFADMDWEFTHHQIELFNRLVQDLRSGGIEVPLVHSANSMGLLAYRNGHFTMVRPGLVLYGLHPQEGMGVRFKPVLSLKTKVLYVKRLPEGRGISYGHIYVTPKKTTIVTLPIGYGDGYPRNLSNKGFVLIKGKRFRISGRVCMDQIMVDVGNTRVRVGDEAVLIGSQKKEVVTTEEVARLAGTIPYEIVCGLGSRIPRVYIDK